MGYVVTDKGFTTDPSKLADMRAWPQPMMVKHLRGFLGFMEYYIKFIKGHDTICRPLTKSLKKESFHCTTEVTITFEELTNTLTCAPVLRSPTMYKTFVIETDTSNVCIGAILINEKSHPIPHQ